MSNAVTTTPSGTLSSPGGGLLNFIERASRDPEFDVAKFGELLRHQRDIVHEMERKEFNRAMAAAQAEMAPIVRDALNTHTGSKYARLEKIDRAMRPIYTKHGFSIRFASAPSPREGWLRIVCTVSHSGGYSEENALDGPPDSAGARGNINKSPVQAIGSTITFLRRYLTAMSFNIVTADDDEDDDGNATRPEGAARPQAQPRRAPDGLDEVHGPTWLLNLRKLLQAAQAPEDVHKLRGDKRVENVLGLQTTPVAIKREIENLFRNALERVSPPPETEAEPPAQDEAVQSGWADPIGALVAEVERMDLVTLNALSTNAAWRRKVEDAVASFPPDEDRLNEVVAARRAALQGGGR